MSDERKLLEKISEDIVDIKVTLAKQETLLSKQEKSLDEHVKRTNLLEDKVEILRDEVTKSKGIKEFILFIAKISSLIGAILIAAKKFL